MALEFLLVLLKVIEMNWGGFCWAWQINKEDGGLECWARFQREQNKDKSELQSRWAWIQMTSLGVPEIHWIKKGGEREGGGWEKWPEYLLEEE